MSSPRDRTSRTSDSQPHSLAELRAALRVGFCLAGIARRRAGIVIRQRPGPPAEVALFFFFFSCCASPEAVTGCTWSIYSRPLCDVAGCGLGSDWGTCAHSGTGANGQLKHTRKKHQASVVGEPWFDASSSRLMIHQGYVPKGYLVRVRTHFGGRNPIGCSVDRRS